MPAIVPSMITVPPCFAKNADQADFYRRGFLDCANGKVPSDMSGYPAALRMAYLCGGLDGAA